LLLLVVSLALYSSYSGRTALADGVGLASEAITESLAVSIDRVIYLRGHEVLTALESPLITDEVKASNDEFEAMDNPEAYIDELDAEWASVTYDVIPETMEEVLDSNLSQQLKAQLVDHYESEHGTQVFTQVELTNEYGAVIAATGRPMDFRKSDEHWWQAAQEGEFYYTDIEHDEISGFYGIWCCMPINDEDGRIIGIARAGVSILYIAKDIELTALGYETSELKIVTADGRLIYSSRAYVILQDISDLGFFEQATESKGHFSEEEGGADRLYSYVRSIGYLDYDGNGWTVFLSHSEDEVLGPATELEFRITVVAALAIALGILIALILSQSITRPISLLETATHEMAKGKLNQKLPVSRKDELGRLAESFNTMASDLDMMYSELDGLVKERTEKLENANKKLSILSSITRHDALNQITVQRGWLDMAKNAAENQEVERYLEKMESTTDNLVNFLKFTSDYENIGVQKPEWISAKNALATATVGLNLDRVAIVSRLNGLELFADPMFHKVLHNLIGNSLKHGGKVTIVSLFTEGTSEGLKLVMEDNGIGVPEDVKNSLFDREHMSGRSSHGLYLAGEILRITKMSIRETGMPGKGARFEISIPKGNFRWKTSGK